MLVFGVAGGVVLVNREALFNLGAAGEGTPKDVRVTNITDTAFTVTWMTDKPVAGFVKWGDTSNLGQTTQADVGSKAVRAHTVTIKGLTKNKPYYFSVNSGGQDYKNNGLAWNTSTAASAPTGAAKISGVVLQTTGAPAEEAIIYVDAPGMTQQSSVSSTQGNWIMSIPLKTDPKETLLDIYVQAGVQGIATAQVYLSGANPVTPITLGKTYDLRSVSSGGVGGVPDSLVTLPTDSTKAGSSRFELSAKTVKPSTTVVIKSTREGERVTTRKPSFFGNGPANTTLTIKLNSTVEITQTVKTKADGSWTFNTPQNLEDGTHTLTISWRNAQGVLQTITRTFVVTVSAAEPAFESTPSGSTPTPAPTVAPTLAPTATPIASLIPTATPTLAPTIAPSLTPRPTATSEALPNAGSPLATVMMLSFGASLVLGGLFVSIKAR